MKLKPVPVDELMTVETLIKQLSLANPQDRVMVCPADNMHHLSVYRVKHPDNGTVVIELTETVHANHDRENNQD